MSSISSALDTIWWWLKRILGWGFIAAVVALVLWLFLLLGTMLTSLWNAPAKAQGRDFVLTTGEEVRESWITWKGVETTPVITYTKAGDLKVAFDCTFEFEVVKCYGQSVLTVVRRPEAKGDPYTFRAETSNVYTRAGP